MEKRLLIDKVFYSSWFIVLCLLVAVCADSAIGAGSFNILVPNGTTYWANNNFVTTAFRLNQAYTANYVVLSCLDDNTNDAGSETFEVAITTNAAGTILVAASAIAQVTNNFRNTGGCDQHMYAFDIGDVALNANTWYYLRTKVINGAAVRLWGESRLYYDGGVPVGSRLFVNVPNGTVYQNNGNSVRTAFSLSQNSTARYVMLNCLDDNGPDAGSETFEVAITTDAAGNNLVAASAVAQITNNFSNGGGCDKRMYIFDFGDVALSRNVTYYLRTKVIADAPVRSWNGAYLYYWPSANYRKFDALPDADKDGVTNPDNSCWMATASNMLAGAGYGTGASIQARADDIYADLVTWQQGVQGAGSTGKALGGWSDTAIIWWLASANNIWPGNPYDVVTVYGNKTKTPWANASGAQFIGNELRRCENVGLSISWPRTTAGGSPSGGHAITSWGDSSGEAPLAANPTIVAICDSDSDTGGNVQTYTYDNYAAPNPGRFNEGSGWYINYNANHPFIKHIVTLCPVAGNSPDFRTSSSYRIYQNNPAAATALHCQVGSYYDIFDYEVAIDWETPVAPVILGDGPPLQNLTVDWDLTARPVPYGRWVSINTQFVLPYSGSIRYRNVELTPGNSYPGFDLNLYTYPVANPNEPNITGGYVVGAFDLINSGTVVGEHRFIHQYFFNQDPESHHFMLVGDPQMTGPYEAANFRFGHSYGYLDPNSLWQFEDWMTRIPEPRQIGAAYPPIDFDLNWEGRLPYPEGEIYQGEFEHPECTTYLPEDLNHDCYVNLKDFAELAAVWLEDTAP